MGSAPDLRRYGLILSSRKASSAGTAKKPNIFADDSDEELGMRGKVKKEPSNKNTLKKQTQLEIDRALAQDPSVYEYDNVYEDLKAKQQEQKVSAAQERAADRKPRYISGLMKMAEQRQREHERRVEREVQREREAEGEVFSGKEEFVTTAYRKKLLELREAEEKEKREAALEEKLDVTKQKDLSGFYRHLYRQADSDMSKTLIPPTAAAESLSDSKLRAERTSADQSVDKPGSGSSNSLPDGHGDSVQAKKGKDVHKSAATEAAAVSGEVKEDKAIHESTEKGLDASRRVGEDSSHQSGQRESTKVHRHRDHEYEGDVTEQQQSRLKPSKNDREEVEGPREGSKGRQQQSQAADDSHPQHKIDRSESHRADTRDRQRSTRTEDGYDQRENRRHESHRADTSSDRRHSDLSGGCYDQREDKRNEGRRADSRSGRRKSKSPKSGHDNAGETLTSRKMKPSELSPPENHAATASKVKVEPQSEQSDTKSPSLVDRGACSAAPAAAIAHDHSASDSASEADWLQKYAKRHAEDSVTKARERYLARLAARAYCEKTAAVPTRPQAADEDN